MKTLRNFLLTLSLLIVLTSFTLENAEIQYIDQYVELAIDEMHRSGIPASIKLGQALLESSAGHSELARNSNNHFGIKCKKYWKGKTYYHKDDDRNSSGHLIESCFRSYDSVEESFKDHSEFLMTTAHYQHLFLLKPDDYIGWAKGLKASGYATDENYARKLIGIIELHGLYRFDRETMPNDDLGLFEFSQSMQKAKAQVGGPRSVN